MSEARPLWRQAFDLVEGAVGPPLKSIVGSEHFAVAAGLAARIQKTAQRQTERNTRRLLHLWNLPAGSDVTRILTELGKLQREMRELSRQVDAIREDDGDKQDGNGRSPGSHQARR